MHRLQNDARLIVAAQSPVAPLSESRNATKLCLSSAVRCSAELGIDLRIPMATSIVKIDHLLEGRRVPSCMYDAVRDISRSVGVLNAPTSSFPVDGPAAAIDGGPLRRAARVL